jgi:Domain of unknown function (DUF2520)
MKKQLQLGLVIEGKAVDCAVLRLPNIADELGPIKSGTLRVARRLSHVLHAGYGVGDYEELQAARLILLHVPDCAVSRIVDELCASDLDFRALAFVLCESWLMIDVLEPLKHRGASVATLIRAPSAQQNWFAVEGQASAVRQIRRLLERNDARAVEIRGSSKSLFLAAELLATVLPACLLAAAEQALRASGISGNPLSALLDQMTQKMLNDFNRGARLVRGGPLKQSAPETAEVHFEHLRREHSQIAQILEEQLDWACRTMPELKAVRAVGPKAMPCNAG